MAKHHLYTRKDTPGVVYSLLENHPENSDKVVHVTASLHTLPDDNEPITAIAREEFEKTFSPYIQQRLFNRVLVTGDWIDFSVPAYCDDAVTWNGFAVPYFTADVVKDMIKKDGFSDITFDEVQKIVSYNTGYEGEREVVKPVTIQVEGSQIEAYPIGDGWCWMKVEETDSQAYLMAIHEINNLAGLQVIQGERDDDTAAFGFDDEDTGAFVSDPKGFSQGLNQSPAERWGLTPTQCSALAWLNDTLAAATQAALDAASKRLSDNLFSSSGASFNSVCARDIGKAIASSMADDLQAQLQQFDQAPNRPHQG